MDVFLCVCEYVCVYMHIYIYIYIYIYVCMYVCMYVCIHKHAYALTHTFIRYFSECQMQLLEARCERDAAVSLSESLKSQVRLCMNKILGKYVCLCLCLYVYIYKCCLSVRLICLRAKSVRIRYWVSMSVYTNNYCLSVCLSLVYTYMHTRTHTHKVHAQSWKGLS
jgi:hypothetical protein